MNPLLWSSRAKWMVGGTVAVLALLFCIKLAIESYGHKQFNAGVTQEKNAWLEADRKLQSKVNTAQVEANHSAAVREARKAEEVAEERKQIDAAVAEGRSPFDDMFGN